MFCKSPGYGREQPNTSDSSHLGRDAALGAGEIGAGSAAHHHHDRERDGTYGNPSDSSHLGRDTAFGSGGALGAGTAAQNYPDRERDGTYNDSSNPSHLGRDAAIGAGALGAGTAAHHRNERDRDGTYGDTSNQSHLGRDAAIGAGALGAGTAAHHHHDQPRDGTYAGSTAGPHSSNLANKADPRVDSDLSGSRYEPTSTSGPGLSSGHTGAYGTTTGPHSSNLANKADPRVDSDRDGSTLASHTGYGTGTGHIASHTGYATGTGHVGGDGPHLTHGPHVTDTANRLDPRVDPSTGKLVKATHAELEPLPGLVGGETSTRAAGGIATGSGHTGPTDSTTGYHHTDPSGTTSGHHHADPTEPTSHTTGPVHKSALLNKLDPRVKTESPAAHDTAGTQHHTSGTQYHPDGTVPTNPADHTGRDLAFTGAGASGIAGLEAATGRDPHGTNVPPSSTHVGTGSRDISGPGGVSGAPTYEAQKHHDRHDPSGTTHSSTHPESGYVDPDNKTSRHHTGRDAALGGAAAATGVELSKKEHERELKKDIKDHEKEQTQHHKALEKEEKRHEKTLEKDDKKHHDDGKKHGGILGLFHRDKKDKHDKDIEEDPKHKDKTHRHETEAVVGAGAVGAGVADHHKHDHDKLHEDPVSDRSERNRLHKDPPAGYGEVPQSGYASQVTGGTGTTALAQGQHVPRGSHLTGLGNDLDPK